MENADRPVARNSLKSAVYALLCASALTATPQLWADNASAQNARPSPAWLREGTIYEIFERDFSAAGNFNGVTDRLDELSGLGVNILWLMPIHPLGEKLRKGSIGSPYAVRDYYGINPDYGTEADLCRLIHEAHRHGMKVILDIVANHTAWDCVLMKHPEFYKQDANGRIIPPVKEWSDVAGLNYQNPELCDYMIAMLKHWIDPAQFDVDGFRCDVAEMVPTKFWERARAELAKVKPDIIMLAEASKPELLVDAFDVDYSWPLLAALNEVLLKSAPATALQHSWEQSRAQFPHGALHMRITDDHDEPRAVGRFGLRGAVAASVLMFCLDGVPLLYNGMEVGDATESGDPALFEKLPIFWHPKDRPPLRDIYKELIRLRHQHPAFCNDRVAWLHNSAPADVVSFMRQDDKEQFVIAINLSNRPVPSTIDVAHDQEFKLMEIAGAERAGNSFPSLRLNGFEWRIYRRPLMEAGGGQAALGGPTRSSHPDGASE